MTHSPTGRATLVVWPDAEHPKSPVMVVIECSCGHPECHWSATAYDPIHNRPKQ